jgi:hypothetical protein
MRIRISPLVPLFVVLTIVQTGSRALAQSALEPPVVSDLNLVNEFPNQVIMGTITAINDPTSWSDLAFSSYTPGFGALPTAPGKHFDPMWDATTQKFNWNTFASSDGTYVWLVTATNAAGDDQGQITVDLRTPEPGTAALAFAAVVGMMSLVRRRRAAQAKTPGRTGGRFVFTDG